jgi:hypothetical protein
VREEGATITEEASLSSCMAMIGSLPTHATRSRDTEAAASGGKEADLGPGQAGMGARSGRWDVLTIRHYRQYK